MFPDIARDEVFRLETRRLWLRWPQAADAAALQALQPWGKDETQRFIEACRAGNAQGAHLRLALTLKTGARDPIGMIGIEDKGQPQLCYWLGVAFRDQGFASEAAAAMADAFFRVTYGEELRAIGNDASIKVLQKVGFARRTDTRWPKGLLALDRSVWLARDVRIA